MNDRVSAAVRRYLAAYPEESALLAPLLALAERPEPVTSRASMPAHVTCGVVALDADRGVLQIQHRALGRWLLPGGHVEAEDRTLLGAALRELTEETGIPPSLARPLLEDPLDIEAHEIPANPARSEPAHTHFDVRYLVNVRSAGVRTGVTVTVQAAEVTDFRWIPAMDLGGRLGTKVAAALQGR